jgi:hypothetical protein
MKPERVETIYNELADLVVELDRDPVGRGPGYIQDLISKTRGFLNKTSVYHQEVMREQYELERDLVAQEAAFDVSSDALLADDNRVTRLPNIDDRKAMINLILREDRVKIQDLKRRVRELGMIEKVIKSRQKELDNTMAAIRMQKSLMDTEVRAGSFYGDETNTSRNRSGIVTTQDDIDDDELTRLLEGEMPSIELSGPSAETSTAQPAESAVESAPEEAPQPVVAAPAEEPKTPVNVSDEDPDISKFLDGDDLSDILNSV